MLITVIYIATLIHIHIYLYIFHLSSLYTPNEITIAITYRILIIVQLT